MKIGLVASAAIMMLATSVETMANNYPHCRKQGSYDACMACKQAQGNTIADSMRRCAKPRLKPTAQSGR